jgi:hypothetical protein
MAKEPPQGPNEYPTPLDMNTHQSLAYKQMDEDMDDDNDYLEMG